MQQGCIAEDGMTLAKPSGFRREGPCMFALTSSKRTILAAVCAAAMAAIPFAANAQDTDDPPPEAGRISYVAGNVSIQPVTSDEWGQAYPNLPLGPGDRIFTDSNGRAEIQIGQTYLRVGPNSDVTLVEDSQFNINFGVAQGSVRLHSFSLWPRQLVDVSTPNGNAEFGQQGDLRVDVLPNDGATVFTNLGQFADITGAGNYRQELDYGQSLEVAGTNPVYPQWLQPAPPDDLDGWSQERDQRLTRVASFNYVSPDIPGAADLDDNGDWQPQTEYGAVWFPRNVPAGWQPYQNGHWINRDPWGWVWVEDEPWGYAPFHYGRWVVYGGRWGWVPGPVNVRPVWSPALVVFAGGFRFGGGGSLSVWFPLGPGEAYRPWYRCSPHYIDRVNITNIREAPRVHVRNTYVNVVNVTNVTYINQTRVVAVRQDDFASGRQVRNVAVRVDPQLAQHIRPLERPSVAPPVRPIITHPVAHPVAVSVHRPVLINQQGRQMVAKPGATPVAPPVRLAPPVRPLPGRTVVAAPARPVPNHPGQQGNQFPAERGQEQRPGNAPYQPYPSGVPRANPVTPVQGYQHGGNQQTGNPNQEHGQQQPQPVGKPITPGETQQPGRPNQPTYQPMRPDAPNSYQQGRPNQPERPNQPGNQPMRPDQPNTYQPVRPNQPERPIAPVQQPHTPNYQEQNRPNQPNYQQQHPNPPQNPQSRPNQPNYQQERPEQPNYQQPVHPNYQPEPRQNPPENPHSRPAPPPPPQRSVEPPRNQPPQARPEVHGQNGNGNQKQNNNKEEKKNEKKHD
jgi:hypothetical protein